MLKENIAGPKKFFILGNTWALCGNGTGAIGCGDQETFRNCADIRIMSHFGHPPNVQLNRPAPNAVFTRDSNNPFGRAQLGAKYLVSFSSHSLKKREKIILVLLSLYIF